MDEDIEAALMRAGAQITALQAEGDELRRLLDAWKHEASADLVVIAALRKEVRYLRQYGNKDCTAMADDAMRRDELDS